LLYLLSVRGEIDISAIGIMLANRGRAAMLTELLSGELLAAGELARRAGISPQAASNHLVQLRAGGMVNVESRGRNRIYSLAGADIAEALEALGRVAPARPVRGLRDAHRYEAIARARTCYDHLAGRLGVQITRSLIERRQLREAESGFAVTRRGERWFAEELEIDLDETRRSRRAFALSCLDLTEREPHVAGALGAALAHAFLERHYAERMRDSRALRLTSGGEAWLMANGVVL
jgi:DNA-binding transcriptional ArsR family regulator